MKLIPYYLRLVSLSALLLCGPLATAQDHKESRDFVNEAQSDAILFRGLNPFQYNVRYSGTNYWESTDFKEGGILYNGKWYEGVYINVDASAGNVHVKANKNATETVLQRNLVDWFTMGDQKFVNLYKQGYNVAPGFFEVIKENGNVLYLRVDKGMTVDQDSLKPGSVAINTFKITNHFFLEKDGHIAKISKMKAKAIMNGKTDLSSIKKLKKNAIAKVEPAKQEVLRPSIPDSLRTASTAKAQASDFKVGDKTIYTTLPAGFFSNGEEKKDDELLRLINAGNEMVTFANKVYDIGSPEKANGDKAYVNGSVRDILSGEPLAGVAVFDDKSNTYTMTDAYGAFQLRLPLGDNTLNFSGYSLEELHLNIMVHSDGGLDVQMKEKITSLKGAVVSAESMVNHRDARMGIEKVRINTITKIPAAFGESDVLKVVLTIPGVKSVGEASSGFNVRGGSSDQNLILFNDGTIYNPSHLFGIFSAFNTDVINDVELYKSSIPAEFGGRISSVLDIKGREGNSNKVTGSLGLGLLTSRFHVEGPIKDNRTTFIVGGRTTYSNWIFNLLPEGSAYSGGNASFSDLNASITRKVNERNTLQTNAYWSRDGFSFDGDTTFRYQNLNASLKWRHIISERTQVNTVAGYDHYSNTLDNSFNDFSGYSIDTGIDQGFIKSNFKTVLNEAHTLSYGGSAVLYGLNPGILSPLGDNSLVIKNELSRQSAIEPAIYASDTWRANDKLTVDMGVRLEGFYSFQNPKFYGAPELRLSGKYSFRDNLSMKAGINTMNQNIHLISNTSSVSPMDAWHLSDAKIRPQEGWQAAAGLYWTVAENKVDLSVETYYKSISRYHDYKSGATLIMNENLADDLVETYGKAYGIEFMAKKSLGKLNGWVAYTYSRSLLRQMENTGVTTINNGEWYRAAHDKPHDFKLVLNYKMTHRYSFSTNVDYSTGRPVTIPVSQYQYGGGTRLAYSLRNGYRIPDYFRMDAALNIDPGHYLRKLTHMTFTIGVYNVTGRKNAYSVYYTTQGGAALTGYKLCVFAAPIPYINLNVKFG